VSLSDFSARVRDATRDGQDLIELATQLLHGPDEKLAWSALQWLADRGFGRAADSTPSNLPISLETLTDEQLDAIGKILEEDEA
jgi:hypothetical protein